MSNVPGRQAFVAAGIKDDDDNELLKFGVVASAVNEVTVSNAAAGNAPGLSATGGDTDINLNLTPKGAGAVVANGPFQNRTNTAVTATSDGLTTGLIPAGSSFVTVTSGNSAHKVSLPAASVGDKITIKVGSTACKLISVTTADTLNNVQVGATNSAVLSANNTYLLQYVAANTWIMMGWTNLGAVQTAVIPS